MSSLAIEAIKGNIHAFFDNEKAVAALLVGLGALFLLSSFSIYPAPLVFVLTVIVAAIAHWNPAFGVLAGLVAAVPLFGAVDPALAWTYVLLTAIAVFEVFEHWKSIAIMEVLIFSPLAPFPFSLVSVLFLPVLYIASLNLGSKEALFLFLSSSVLSIVLSTLFHIPHQAFPLSLDIYRPFLRVGQHSIAKMFSYQAMAEYPNILALSLRNLLWAFTKDNLLVYFGVFAAAVYLVGKTPALVRRSGLAHAIASLPLLMAAMFNPNLLPGWFLCLLIGLYLDFNRIKVFREDVIEARERMRKFGKFGVMDLYLTDVSMKDIADYEDIKQEIMDAFRLPMRPEVAYFYRLKPPKGILLFGPPGTGKTLLVSAISKELGYRFYYVKSSSLLSHWFGETERNISEIFEIARKNQPCVLFFDEIEAIGKKRESMQDDTSMRALSVFLQEIDGLKKKSRVVVVGATNMPHILDPALLRPGRFDKLIYVPPPNAEARKEIFKLYISRVPHEEIDLDKLAAISERYTGADIRNVVEEAKKLAAKEALSKGRPVPLSMRHLLAVMRGYKPSLSLSLIEEYERFRMDYERALSREKSQDERIYSWKDVADLEEVKEAFEESLKIPLIYEEKIKELGIRPVRGILLFGPPGTGKTLLVKAAVGELNVSLVSLNAAELTRYGVLKAAEVIKESFNRARENAPAILFIDEIESIAPKRGDFSSPVLTQLLTEMDGISEHNQKVVVVGASNLPWELDPALLRPGRFDKLIYVPPPNAEARKEIFKIHLGKYARDLDLDKLAAATEGFTGADIASVCQAAKMRILKAWIKGVQKALTTEEVLAIIQQRKPSVNERLLAKYQAFLNSYGERK